MLPVGMQQEHPTQFSHDIRNIIPMSVPAVPDPVVPIALFPIPFMRFPIVVAFRFLSHNHERACVKRDYSAA